MDRTFESNTAVLDDPVTARLLYGSDPMPGIVSVERAGPSRVRLYVRNTNNEIEVQDDRFSPWLLAERAEPWQKLASKPRVEQLSGELAYQWLVEFDSWPMFLDATRAADDAREPYFRLRSPVEQYLVMSGRTLFKDMTFDQLSRLQLDIETLGLDFRAPGAELIIVALSTSGGREELIVSEGDEGRVIDQLNDLIQQIDPDVIEGHNLFNFDLPFLQGRAARANRELLWGRDGSPVRISENGSRFKAGPLTMTFSAAYVAGRSIIDTYQQVQRYDSGGKLSSYGLKNVIAELGFTRDDRVFIPGEQISQVWANDRARLLDYALDDVRDVRALANLTTQTEFYQAQIVPRTYQAVATGGPGEKINDIMLRAYLSHRHSIPRPEAARDYPGGHAELLATGSFHPIVKCDVESLYPSIMLSDRIAPGADTLNAYLPMLQNLTRRRLHAKARGREARRENQHREQAMWEGLQSSFKVLINSFYGYLGYGGALFNDYDAATRVTLAGQRIIRHVVDELVAAGAQPIEVDTDGVYFVPPPDVRELEQEEAFIERISSSLPDGIRLAHDGRYAGMLSLRLKTYALLDYDGSLTVKGSALRSRRMEPCFREFLQKAALAYLHSEPEQVKQLYFDLADRIRERRVEGPEIVQWGFLNDANVIKSPRFQRLLARRPESAGQGSDRIEYYERQDGEFGWITEFAHDENSAYLLRRLNDVMKRFQDLYPASGEFDARFPLLTPRTDFAMAKAAQPVQQLGLF